MRASFATFFLATAISVLTVSASPDAEFDFTAILKRQAEGTPSYTCHADCGAAITQSKLAEPCKNEVFLAKYQKCLECSGTTKENIWSMYGRTLGTAGAACGLSTTPIEIVQSTGGVQNGTATATATGNSTILPTASATGNTTFPTADPSGSAGNSITSNSLYALLVAGAALILV
ncbi:hypothetical protein DFH27DRAFT_49984 [Peziza echinospora]|nr:hypothetical protein DFH27DRAFT_49984 [Peziza echinospora]